jgi:hypothetical protein
MPDIPGIVRSIRISPSSNCPPRHRNQHYEGRIESTDKGRALAACRALSHLSEEQDTPASRVSGTMLLEEEVLEESVDYSIKGHRGPMQLEGQKGRKERIRHERHDKCASG